MTSKTVYISWHYTTHGIAYFKHILSAFYTGRVSVKSPHIEVHNIEQTLMNEVFETSGQKGFLFDKAYYLYVSEATIQKLTDRRFKYRSQMYERDEEVEKTKMQELWKAVIDQQLPSIQKELAFVKKEFGMTRQRKFEQQLWRDMQHYTIDEQLWWWKEKSNARKYYDRNRFEAICLDKIQNLRNEQAIAKELIEVLNQIVRKHPKNTQFIINVSLGTNETQVVWFLLTEAGLLPPNTRFIKTYDDKSDGTNKRFKKFSIIEVPKTILSDVKYALRIYENPHSNSRKLAALKMQTYRRQGFAILILGERGTGKSRLVEEIEAGGQKVCYANCAAFDEDSKAESELFGYKRGAFTGADKDHWGLFYEAKNGVLFFDEVHHLSKRVQGKLMKALQTDAQNKFRFRPLGDTKEAITNFTAMFASNLPLEELKKSLLPDFFDRISQLIIELPPLRQTPEEIEKDWEIVWKQLRFKIPVPKEKELLAWLKLQPLYGNYRDLQKIAIYYKSFLELPEEAKAIEGAEDAFDFAKKQFLKYYNTGQRLEKHPLLDYLLADDILFNAKNEDAVGQKLVKRFQRLLVEWVEHEMPNKKAHKLLKIAEKTFYNWKNSADQDPPNLDFL